MTDKHNDENVVYLGLKSVALENQSDEEPGRCFSFGYDTEPDEEFINKVDDELECIGLNMAI